MENFEREFGWNDTIQNDSTFEVLPEGDYDFAVEKFERGRHNGSDKLPPCNKAILTIKVSNGQKSTTLEHNLFLHTKTEGMLCQFFTAIGQRRHGESLQMDWNRVIGAKGRCKLTIREWTSNKTGEKMQSNQISRFYEPAETSAQSFTPGKF